MHFVFEIKGDIGRLRRGMKDIVRGRKEWNQMKRSVDQEIDLVEGKERKGKGGKVAVLVRMPECRLFG